MIMNTCIMTIYSKLHIMIMKINIMSFIEVCRVDENLLDCYKDEIPIFSLLGCEVMDLLIV